MSKARRHSTLPLKIFRVPTVKIKMDRMITAPINTMAKVVSDSGSSVVSDSGSSSYFAVKSTNS